MVSAGKRGISDGVFAYTLPEMKQDLHKTWGSLIILSQEASTPAALDDAITITVKTIIIMVSIC